MYISTARDSTFSQNFFLSTTQKTLKFVIRIKFSKCHSARFFHKKTAFRAAPTDKRKSAYLCRLLKLFLVIIILMSRYYTKAKNKSRGSKKDVLDGHFFC